MTAHEADRWSLVVAAGLVIFMAQLDTTIVLVALPAIAEDLDLPRGAAQWVMLGYLVPLIALSLRAGRWVDRVGLRPALLLSVTIFAIASVAAAVAPTTAWLVLARVGKGAAGALLLASAPALAATAVRPEVRGRALAVVATLAPLGGMSGPALGGLLVDRWGWPWIFLVNLPVAALVIVIVRARTDQGGPLRRPERGWATDVLLLGGTAVALLLGLTPSDDGRLATLWLVPVGLVLAALWWRTAGARDLRALLASVPMLAAHGAFAGTYLAVLAVQFLTPFFLREQLGATAAVIGATMLAYPAATAVMGPVSGWAADRWSPRSVAVVGAALLAAAMLLLAPLDTGWSAPGVAVRLAIVGATFGLFVTPNQTFALSLVDDSALGTTSASTNLARLVGLAAGPATATAAWASSGYAPGGMRLGVVLGALVAAASAGALLLAGGRAGPGRRSPRLVDPAGSISVSDPGTGAPPTPHGS
ncbi:MFS transporter [Nitriliruptor alkaliphilus]|uniref:MFS transporter n=1 Tax=Nitriliruptor alkaliphilus TaxID=427918 RepID=UPI0012EE2079|nr:MFS transporter [Nitriliruptor alkaliphilus]